MYKRQKFQIRGRIHRYMYMRKSSQPLFAFRLSLLPKLIKTLLDKILLFLFLFIGRPVDIYI